MSILHNRIKYVLSPQFDIYKMISEVASFMGGKVADVGCGLGFGCHLFDNVDGYDIDSDNVGAASQMFPKIRFKIHDITKRPLPEEYDVITAIDVIEHIIKDKRFIKYVYNSLKSHGTFICSTPNRLCRYRKSANHIREYSPEELKKVLSRYFVNTDICTYGWKELQTGYENPLIAICRR
jgi:2-polyprenyl-3-methyl-5-hydroxy-6-metoxy-1,4-benzoquinol methylase